MYKNMLEKVSWDLKRCVGWFVCADTENVEIENLKRDTCIYYVSNRFFIHIGVYNTPQWWIQPNE